MRPFHRDPVGPLGLGQRQDAPLDQAPDVPVGALGGRYAFGALSAELGFESLATLGEFAPRVKNAKKSG